MRIGIAMGILLAARLASAADVSGAWIAQVDGNTLREPLYARVNLQVDGSRISGSWSDAKVEGSISGGEVQLVLRQTGGRVSGTLTGRLAGDGMAGAGTLEQRAGEGRGGGLPAQLQQVAFRMTRAPSAPAKPKTWDFTPKEFHSFYSAAATPVLHIFPGDTVRTWTIDSGGLDSKRERLSPGGNPETGPFYIEGALPGDTLVVKLDRVRLNRDTARSGSRINPRSVTPAFTASAKYDNGFNSEWKLDIAKGVARLANPTERMKNFTVPLLPMLGCLATAPPGSQSYRAVDLGTFGGNMDYNLMNEGVTLYLPVYHPGALFFLGDAHAAMGDGELTGGALETSMDVQFTVNLVKGFATAGPRLESSDYLTSMGIAGGLHEALQAATAQLADWMKADYKLNDNEVALLLGTVMKYEVTELVDPQYNIVAKVPKSALAAFR